MPTQLDRKPTPSQLSLLPVYVIALSAFVAIWGGWVGLGGLTSFGPIQLLPGILDWFVVNSAITLPLGLEAYAALALRYFLVPPPGLTRFARAFAGCSALVSLLLGAGGQVAYHLMVADGLQRAPWQITAAVSCLPVVVLGCAAALVHLVHRGRPEPVRQDADRRSEEPTAARPLSPWPPAPLDWAPPAPVFRQEVEAWETLGLAADAPVPAATPTGRDEEPPAADREPTDEYDRGLDNNATNDALVADLKEWAADRGREGRRPPSRDDVVRAYGVGGGRAKMLRRTCGWPRGTDEEADRSDDEPTAAGEPIG